MKTVFKTVVAFLLCLPLASGAAQPADLILTNARIYTVNSAKPWAEALAVRGDRIVAVGSAKEIKTYRDARTRMLDGQQHLVLPGFIDSHVHFIEGSLTLGQARLEGTSTLAEIQKILKQYAEAHPEQQWILGQGWSYTEFEGGLPNKKDIDSVIQDRPVLLEGFDLHSYWANSKALELAGIDKNTPDPPNGIIVRDPNTGVPTGALQEAAVNAVAKLVPPPSRAVGIAALRDGMALADQAGLTQVVICGNDTAGRDDYEFIDLYNDLYRSHQLTLRFYMSNYQAPDLLKPEDLQKIDEARKNHPAEDPWLAWGAVKFYLDGVVESHTAAMLTPYADDPRILGSLRWTPEHYKQAVAELDRRGIQIFTHAIGERAVRLALDAYAEAAQENHTKDVRHRIEHIETITAQDIPRFGQLGVIASFQPLHAYPDSDTLDVWLKNAGHEREPRAWAWQSIATTGGHEAFGSDWPVVTLNPWQGIQTALTRQTREGTPPAGWVPEQRLSLEQAIAGYTLGAAYAIHRENEEGSLQPGKLADFIVLSQDLFKIDPHQVSGTKVLLTVVGGKSVYESPEWLKMQSSIATKASKE